MKITPASIIRRLTAFAWKPVIKDKDRTIQRLTFDLSQMHVKYHHLLKKWARK